MKLFRRDRESPLRGNRRRSSSAPPKNTRRSRESVEATTPHEVLPAEGKPAGQRALKIGVAALKLLVFLGAMGLTVWGGTVAYKHATTSSYFAVDDIGIDGAQRISSAQVLAAAEVEPGVNVFSLDVEAIARRLEEQPWIAEAKVSRAIPRSLDIEIRERRPELLVVFDVPYLVDDGGEIFKRWAPKDPVGLPILSGVSREQLVQDPEGVGATVRSAIALVRRYRASGLERTAPLAEVHVEVAGGFSLTLGEKPFYVKFGKGPYRTKLKRLASLLSRMRRDDEEPAMIFFDNEVRPDRVTVKTRKSEVETADDNVALSRAE